MPEGLKSFLVTCEGGLDLTQDVLMKTPGSTIQMLNFEPGLTGGYKRLTGYQKYSSTAVTGQGKVLGVSVFSSGVIAVRPTVADATKADWLYGTGTTWTKINTDTRSTPSKVRATRYNWNGTERITFVDGVNAAAKWDGTTWTVINGVGAPTNPSICTEFKNYLVLSGYTSGAGSGAITMSTVLDDEDYGAGAKEIVIGDDVVALISFRDALIIFCRRSIHQMTGSTSADFIIKPITTKIGCVSADSVQEVNGDLVFLAPDGLRTLAGTAKIGDVELANISHKIRSLLAGINTSTFNICSNLVRAKNQYRLFYNTDNDTDQSAKGIIGGLQLHKDGVIAWEWGELQSIRAYCSDSLYVGAQELVVHGGYDGYVYQQEIGNTFNGENVFASFTSPDFYLEDSGVRKIIHRVIIYAKADGIADFSLSIFYDHDSSDKVQPASYQITNLGGLQFVYDSISTTYDDDAVYNQTGDKTLYRQNVAGSGFQVAFQFSSNDQLTPYTILGYSIEYSLGGRR